MRVACLLKLGVSAAVAAMLVACGGGLPDATTSPVVVSVDQGAVTATPGTSFEVAGSATSQPNAMKTITWTVTKLTAGADDLALANADCASSTRSGNAVNGITHNEWGCRAVVTVPSPLKLTATYRFTFTGLDEVGNSNSAFRDVSIAATSAAPASAPPVANTQATVSAIAGDNVGLSCLGSGGAIAGGSKYVYTWVVKSNPDGLLLTLNAPGDGQLLFKAPAVHAPSSVTLQCRVLDDALSTGTADTVVTLSPSAAIASIANAGATQTVAQNNVVELDASASASHDGSPVFFLWQQTGGPSVSLSDAAAMKPTFTAPMVTQTTRLTFQVTAMTTAPANPAKAAASEVATVSVYVMPEQPLSLSMTPATVARAGTAVNLRVTIFPASGALYYGWTQVSGPAVTLGGANTSSASFVAPDVGTAPYVDSVFSVNVSRKPLATAQPSEIYTSDVVVRSIP